MKTEIDLINFVKSIIGVLKRRSIIILVINVVGLAFGYLVYKRTSPYYTREILVKSMFLENSETLFIVEQLQKEIQKGEFDVLDKKLNLDEKESRVIKSLAVNILMNNDNSVSIEISTYDHLHLKKVQDGVMHYLNNNPYIVNQVVTKEKMYNDMVAHIDEEFSKMDKLIGEQMLSSDIITNADIAKLYEVSVILQEKKTTNRQLQQINEGYSLVKGIEQISRSENEIPKEGPNLNIYIIVSLVLSISFSVFLVLVLEAIRMMS